MKHAN